jgi:hypothetical protein
MRIINLTFNTVFIYDRYSFLNLEQVDCSDSDWIADGTIGNPLATFPSEGLARTNKDSGDPYLVSVGENQIPIYPPPPRLSLRGTPRDKT